MKRDLRFEAIYSCSPERVWRALTNREELSQWLMETDFQPKQGHRFRFYGKPRPGFDGTVRCEIVDMDEPRRLAYRWVTGNVNTVVRFSLEPAGEQRTRVILEHTGFDGTGTLMLAAMLGWNRMLQRTLPTTLSGDSSGTNAAPEVQCNVDIISAVIDRYDRGSSAFEELVASVPPDFLDVAPEGGWGIRQIALHIVDGEIVGAMRLRMIAAQPGSTLAGYRGDVWGRELAYGKQPLGPAVQMFVGLRRVTTTMLRLLPQSAWQNRAEHEEAGEVTLESYLDSHCEHAEAHLDEIRELLAKLRPVAVEGR